MSSSFPAARFPALGLSKERVAGDSVYQAGETAQPSDETLIARICSGEDEALSILLRRYGRLVWSIAERILGDSAEAEDVMQEVFLCVYRKASIFDSSKGEPRTLIVHMTYQRAFTRRTYLAARHSLHAIDSGKNAERAAATTSSLYDESIEGHFGREGLRKALAEMSEDQRETLRLFFFEGYTLDEIALQLGQSRGNVKHHYYRGLERLRKRLPRKSPSDL